MEHPTPADGRPIMLVALAMAGLGLLLAGVVTPAEASTRVRQEGTTARDARVRLAIDAGEVHSCAVKADGTVQCWGGNFSGQLGDGSTTDRLSPTASVGGLSQAVAVSAGTAHTCALRVNGTVRCWGDNFSGQLGDGSTTQRNNSVAVRDLTGAVEISVGAAHSCALLHDGTVRCWGQNEFGQLGDGTTDRRLSPGNAVRESSGAVLRNVVSIAAGNDHTCALRADGTVRCWGSNAFGQLGDGTETTRLRAVPVTNADQSILTNVVAITANSQSCAVRADGTARCWGDNSAGQLGNGTSTDPRSRAAPVRDITDFVTITAGYSQTCAVRATGGAACWGANFSGQLGDGTLQDRATPVAVSGLTNALAVTTGGAHTCALQADGSRRCWGSNGFGQLGDGTGSDSLTPNVVAGGAGGISGRDVAAGSLHTCAVRASGTAACWGENADGQLGDGSRTDRRTPVPVRQVTGAGITDLGSVAMITPGEAHTCALVGDGTVRCWGDDAFGQLGDGGVALDALTGVTVRNESGSILTGIVAVTAGASHTCALHAAGGVACWGGNSNGQLGDGTETDRIRAVVTSVANIVAISAGGSHTCALAADGSARCWGANFFGQLGDGTQVERGTPVTVTGLGSAVGMAAGSGHTCALLADGTVRCWGRNNRGQLGNGSTGDRSTPVAVTGLTGAVAVAAAVDHTCALLADGRARCWGANNFGQLGNGSTTSSLTSVGVTGLTTAVAISTGGRFFATDGPNDEHTCALRVNGAPFCWGRNNTGQIGDNTTTDRLSPREVPSFRANILPTATLASNGQRVLATAVVNCPVDHQVTIEMTLVQGSVTGQGDDTDRCRGRLVQYPVEVSVRQGAPFQPGDAHAEITATVRYGHRIVEVHEWDRDVDLLATP